MWQLDNSCSILKKKEQEGFVKFMTQPMGWDLSEHVSVYTKALAASGAGKRGYEYMDLYAKRERLKAHT